MLAADFAVSPTTAITVVDKTSSAELLAKRGGRKPEDARADRITLQPTGDTTVSFWGSRAWGLADIVLVAWADTVRLGRTATVTFDVRFGDGTTYRGDISIARGIRRGRPRLAEQCRRLETFAACFCPDLDVINDRARIEAMLAYFLKNYEVGEPPSRVRRSTPVPTSKAA